ncbi:Myb-like DNA-binding domain containing protein [Tritrichomonas foetus]|uniref:Myb-like DNA-binding domain containing protein n=1 Tax=Tritrichomonas foetus TaxID=1144522 RepID=A0A1J4KQ99_9EUKA|nr:Myb-like DNA-binding domain containing protein [Tritrichomonas foetus]|eukprot:OHT13481.1 Myb-like DNA-binding domain containing protein [Tritrichomonas foetus]
MKAARKRNKFTLDEDNLLKELVAENGENWSVVASKMPGRNVRQVKERYLNYLSPTIKHGDWTYEEDHLLVLLVFFKRQHWSSLKKSFPRRSDVAIRNRFLFIHRNVMQHIKYKLHQNMKMIEKIQENEKKQIISNVLEKDQEYTNQQIDELKRQIDILKNKLDNNQSDIFDINFDFDLFDEQFLFEAMYS